MRHEIIWYVETPEGRKIIKPHNWIQIAIDASIYSVWQCSGCKSGVRTKNTYPSHSDLIIPGIAVDCREQVVSQVLESKEAFKSNGKSMVRDPVEKFNQRWSDLTNSLKKKLLSI